MGNKVSFLGNCKGKKQVKKRKRRDSRTTPWQNVDDTSGGETRRTRTKSMELTLEMIEIENQIENIIMIDESKRSKEDLKELKRLIAYKELKSSGMNKLNETTDQLWE
tara:strand:+ start:205 stop:528 length:324 start_codon:yes stop_codon:yes gene_type:complete